MTTAGVLLLLLWQRLPAAEAQMPPTTYCPPLDCSIGLNNWRQGWSSHKKAYCCKNVGVACPAVEVVPTVAPVYPDCTIDVVGAEAAWTTAKQEWCCKQMGVACPPTTTTACSFDCQVGLVNWRMGWAKMKIDWCCKHEGLACEETITVTTTPPPSTTECHFDCQVGLATWQSDWAQAKIDWCCKHKGLACPPTTVTATTSTDTTTTGTTTTGTTITGTSTTATGTTTTATTTTTETTTATTTTTPVPTTITTTTTACHFDCQVGLANWRLGWAQTKIDWCCKHEGIACSTTTSTATTTPAPTTTSCPFDCKAGLDNWRAGWARPKKQWCCEHEKVGCEEVMTCHLACFGEGARPLPLPGSVGAGGGAMLTDVSLDECSSACGSMEGCDGVMYTNKSNDSPFKSMCYGKRNIHTNRCQPGGHTYLTRIFGDSRPWGKCAVFGDPHILSFDHVYGPPVTMTDPGEFYLVKSKDLTIQGRFGYTHRFPTASSTVGVAVGGAMIRGHTLVVAYVGPKTGRTGFKVFWDGERILESYPSTFAAEDGSLRAAHNAMDPDDYHREGRHTIGGVQGVLPSYLFKFEHDLTIYVLIGPDNCNVIIENRKLLEDQDGYCGNFNCDTEDDTLDALSRRGLADPMPAEESLFKYGEPAPAWVMKKVSAPSLEDCDPKVKAEAMRTCGQLPEGDQHACIFDACAAHTATAAAQDVSVLRTPEDEGKAASPPSSRSKACAAPCKLHDGHATCAERINYLRVHSFGDRDDGCEAAHRSVIEQCASACSGCSLEASGCSRSQNTTAPDVEFKRKPDLDIFKKFVAPLSSEKPAEGLGFESWRAARKVGGLAACALLVAALMAFGVRAWRRQQAEDHRILLVSSQEEAWTPVE